MNPADVLAELAAAPNLTAAACAGQWDLYDRTDQATATGPAGAEEVAQARAEALRICAGCPELDPCGNWLDSLPPRQRPLGVVAGRINTPKKGRSKP